MAVAAPAAAQTTPNGQHLDGAGVAQLIAHVIGSQTAAEMAAFTGDGVLAYNDANEFLYGRTNGAVKHIPWEDGTPSTSFMLNDAAAAATDQMGFLQGANGISAQDGAGSLVPFLSGNLIATGSMTSISTTAGGHRVGFQSNQATTGTTDYTLTFPAALPATGTVQVNVDNTGAVTFAAVQAGIPEYADDAARVTDGYAGVWRDPNGNLFDSDATTAGATAYLKATDGELVQAAAPGAPTAGDIYYTGNTIQYQDSTNTTQTLATLNDIANAMNWRGTFDASGGQRPDQAGVTNIEAGDLWIITTGGTLAGIEGADVLEAGDFLIATADAPTTGAGYAGIQTNINVNFSTYLAFENQTVNVAGAAVVATFTTLTNVQGAEAYSSTGIKRTTFIVQIASATTVSINSLTTETNVRVMGYGIA